MFLYVVMFRVNDACWKNISGVNKTNNNIEYICEKTLSASGMIEVSKYAAHLYDMANACGVSDDSDSKTERINGLCEKLYDKREYACRERVVKAASIDVCLVWYPELADIVPEPTKTPRIPKPTTNSSVIGVSSVVEHINLSGALLQAFYATVGVDAVLLLVFVCTACGCCGAKLPDNVE